MDDDGLTLYQTHIYRLVFLFYADVRCAFIHYDLYLYYHNIKQKVWVA